MSAYTYTEAEVEALLPGVWDRDFITQTFMGGSSAVEKDRDPRHTYAHIDGVIDVKGAWKNAGLSLEQKQALLLRYGLDEGYEAAGRILGVVHTTVMRRAEAGVTALTEHLNRGRA